MGILDVVISRKNVHAFLLAIFLDYFSSNQTTYIALAVHLAKGHSFRKQYHQFMKTRSSSSNLSKLARADISCQFMKPRSFCRTIYKMNGLYLAVGLNQEQSDLTSAVNATYIRKHQRYYLYK